MWLGMSEDQVLTAFDIYKQHGGPLFTTVKILDQLEGLSRTWTDEELVVVMQRVMTPQWVMAATFYRAFPKAK